MKIYIAARTRRAGEARALGQKLKSMGHFITFEWYDARQPGTKKRSIRGETDYRALIEQEIKAAYEAEVFVLISEPGMRGTYVEMGAFLAGKIVGKLPLHKLIIVGGKEEAHIFETIENAYYAASVEEVPGLLDKSKPSATSIR